MEIKKPVFCFGELLLRMSPLPDAQWIQQSAMPFYIGGAECNVAAALAAWHVPVQYCTALPKNALSDDICRVLASKRIDISPVRFSGNRIGIYYLTQGADLKHTSVIYDRAFSSFSELMPGMLDWEKILEEAGWFHFSAISPALNQNLVSVCKEALAAARTKGIPVSIDLNHRAKLWQWGKQPVEVMPDLVEECDVIMGNVWSANALLSVPVNDRLHEKGSRQAYVNQAAETAEYLMRQFPRCKVVAQTFRFDNDSGVKYYATLNESQHQYVSKDYCGAQVQDKVGSGDCFMAGLIYGFVHHHPQQHIIDFAAAAAVGKMNEPGDSTTQTIESIEQIINAHA